MLSWSYRPEYRMNSPPTGPQPVKPNRIVLRAPELTLKGRNRGFFEKALVRNVALKMASLGLRWRVRSAHGRVNVDVDPHWSGDLSEILQVLSEIAGVESLAAALWLRAEETRQQTGDPDRTLIEDTLVRLARASHGPGKSFAVRVNRVDKRLPMKSIGMEGWLGQAVRDRTEWEKVNLGCPDVVFAIDVYLDGMYFRVGRTPGIGGLPVGTGGRVLALLSGGIDSPVAAFEMAKRGCEVDFFHLTASHAQQGEDSYSVVRLAKSLSRYTLRSRFFSAPATHLDLALTGPPTGYEAILFRRFLVRAASVLAHRIGARALVSGDSLGQVASQTLENLGSVYRATDMPILPPLIGANKQQTIDTARRIGTYGISIEPSKDCCALLALLPKTHSDPDELQALEEQLLPRYDRLLSATLADLVWRTFDCGAATGGWHTTDEDPDPQGVTSDTPGSRGSHEAAAASGGESG